MHNIQGGKTELFSSMIIYTQKSPRSKPPGLGLGLLLLITNFNVSSFYSAATNLWS